jgi:predicted nuclease of restriction endonuclease-like (RecB) superfamily
MKTPELNTDAVYKKWLIEIKQSFQQTQLKAAVRVNSTLLEFYWQLGSEIIEKQKSSRWGDGFLKQLSQDLSAEFPAVKGFSLRNIKYIRQWYRFYMTDLAIGQQAVSQLSQIPWGHNIAIIELHYKK